MTTGQNITINNNYGALSEDGFSDLGGVKFAPVAMTEPIKWTVRPRPPQITLPDNSAALFPKADKRSRKPREWYRFENAAADDEAADVWIYDEISDPFLAEFFGIGISAAGFVKELQTLKGKALNVHINSPGGSVFEGLAIYNALRAHQAPVNVIVDGAAFSIASVIAMSGDTVTMAPHSMMMIHEPWGITIGNAADHAQQVKVLNKIGDDIAAVYNERADSRINWRAKMAEETWLTDEDAVKLGLADRIDTQATPAQNSFDLSRFRNVPADLAPGTISPEDADPTPTKRTAEQALRDAGFSVREAKAIVAKGWVTLEEARDVSLDATDPDAPVAPGGNDDDADDTTGKVAADAIERQRIADFRERRERALGFSR